MPSSTFTTIDVRAPIEDAWSFLANLENAASWWPFVVGSAIHVRARLWCLMPSRGADACVVLTLARSLVISRQRRHVSRWLPDLPIRTGTCYRLLLSPPLAEVLHLCVVEWRPPAYAEWRGSSAARHMRLELSLQRSPDAPQAVTRVELRWQYEWRGWRRLRGAVPEAHLAARAAGTQAAVRVAAAFAEGRHLAYRPAEAPTTPIAGPPMLADAVPVSATTVLPGSAVSVAAAVLAEDISAA